MPIVGIIVALIVSFVLIGVSGITYVITCVQVASNGVTLDEITFLQNFRTVADVVIGFETFIIATFLAMNKLR